ncbi:MAG: hypothetical protein HYR64_09160 [Fimbriimonas ginsengisoli]|uniref:Uncharacterized protein n=1 Tax=Fimbriimonas ginsengisoli TaxID=1005039 RepID=A0A931PWF2_FIMGI|nr:hypothetical protein [Fimbriimonas ginsengisoli]
MARCVALAFVVAATFMASSLVGHVAAERARREAIEATTRLRIARKAEAMLAERVEGISNLAAIQSWAASNGYQPREVVPRAAAKRMLVASR